MSEEEVFVRAYCAALGGIYSNDLDISPETVRMVCSKAAEDAVESWLNRSDSDPWGNDDSAPIPPGGP